MAAGSERGLEVLLWIVLVGLAGVIAATVALLRSGRSVSLPALRWRSRGHARR